MRTPRTCNASSREYEINATTMENKMSVLMFIAWQRTRKGEGEGEGERKRKRKKASAYFIQANCKSISMKKSPIWMEHEWENGCHSTVYEYSFFILWINIWPEIVYFKSIPSKSFALLLLLPLLLLLLPMTMICLCQFSIWFSLIVCLMEIAHISSSLYNEWFVAKNDIIDISFEIHQAK